MEKLRLSPVSNNNDQNENTGGNSEASSGDAAKQPDGLAKSKEGGSGGEKSYSDKTYDSFKKQLDKDGRKSLEKSRAKLQRRLNEHQTKLEEYKKAGGNTSSVEREIRTFKGQIDAIDDLLK